MTHHNFVFVGYNPRLTSIINEEISKAHNRFIPSSQLHVHHFPNESDFQEVSKHMSSADGVIFYPIILKQGISSADYELVIKCNGNLRDLILNREPITRELSRRRAENNQPTLMVFDPICYDSNMSEYEDWQGERDSIVHKLPWNKNFKYLSTKYLQSSRTSTTNDLLDKIQLEEFAEFLNPGF